MNNLCVPSPSLSGATPARSIPMRRIALPNEHGGWGFLGEPLIAGLAIAVSPTALWIAVMTIGAFMLRQPLRLLIADRMGRRNKELAATAFGFALFYMIIFGAGLVGTLATAGIRPLIPFFIVFPLVVVHIYFDVSRRSRSLVPEIGGAISISGSIAAIAIAGGFSFPSAAALWFILIARLVPSILYVRERLRLEKGKPYSYLIPVSASLVALLLVTILAFCGLVPVIAPAAMMILLFRAIAGLSPTRKKMRAMQIGVWEIIYGIATVVILIIGYHAGL